MRDSSSDPPPDGAPPAPLDFETPRFDYVPKSPSPPSYGAPPACRPQASASRRPRVTTRVTIMVAMLLSLIALVVLILLVAKGR